MISNFKSLFFYKSVYNYVSRETLNKYLTKHIEYKLIIKKILQFVYFFIKKLSVPLLFFCKKFYIFVYMC